MNTNFTVTMHVFDPHDGEWRVTEGVPFRSAYRYGLAVGPRFFYNRVERIINFREKPRRYRGQGKVIVLAW